MKQNIRLTAPEISALWTQYMNDSMAICVLTYFDKTTDDLEIKNIIKYALDLSNTHIKKVTAMLQEAKYPIPKGFTKEDVNLDAPPLFSGTFVMQYLYVMTLHGMNGYSLSVGTSVREDQRSYYIQCMKETMELYDQILAAMLDKGIFSRPPYINAPHDVDFIYNKNYMSGYFGKKRPLNGIEIGNIYYNMQKTIVKIVLEIGFSQVTHSKELREYFQRGAKLCNKHIDIFSTIMSNDHLPSPRNWTSEVSNSVVSPFSDKLMLFHIVNLITVSVGYYGSALSTCQRNDLIVQYLKLMTEIGFYAEDGAELLIKNGWLEQPPSTDDREALAKKK